MLADRAEVWLFTNLNEDAIMWGILGVTTILVLLYSRITSVNTMNKQDADIERLENKVDFLKKNIKGALLYLTLDQQFRMAMFYVEEEAVLRLPVRAFTFCVDGIDQNRWLVLQRQSNKGIKACIEVGSVSYPLDKALEDAEILTGGEIHVALLEHFTTMGK